MISFRIDWFDLLAVQGTLKKSSPAPQFNSIGSLTLSLLTVQLSHPYLTTGKTMALTIWAFVSKVMSLLFNTLSRIVMAIFPRSKHLLIILFSFFGVNFRHQNHLVNMDPGDRGYTFIYLMAMLCFLWDLNSPTRG